MHTPNIASPHRLVSLDIFRGLTVMFMIIVNNPGTWQFVYPPLCHAQWNGLTPTDCVFPFFVFILGMSIPFALTSSYISPPSSQTYWKILTRTLQLFALGLLINVFPKSPIELSLSHLQALFSLEHIRIMGILQRLAIVYGCCSLIFLHTHTTQRIILSLSLLIFYSLALLYWPYAVNIDGKEEWLQGMLLPGNNLSAYVDNLILGKNHVLYPTQGKLPFDPEGLLSTLPAIVTGVIGLEFGNAIQRSAKRSFNLVLLSLLGGVLILAGATFTPLFPLNKTLWSTSFVLVTSGLSILCFMLLYLIFESYRINISLNILKNFGHHALYYFVLSVFLAKLFLMIQTPSGNLREVIFNQFFSHFASLKLGSFAYSLFFLILCYNVKKFHSVIFSSNAIKFLFPKLN